MIEPDNSCKHRKGPFNETEVCDGYWAGRLDCFLNKLQVNIFPTCPPFLVAQAFVVPQGDKGPFNAFYGFDQAFDLFYGFLWVQLHIIAQSAVHNRKRMNTQVGGHIMVRS